MKIILRADSGFCGHRMLTWCERHGVGYVVGLAKNSRSTAEPSQPVSAWPRGSKRRNAKQRDLAEFSYAARTWDQPRRVIARLEHGEQCDNPRYIVTNLDRDAATLYDGLYCARGEMENRIKETQLGLFADRTSCHHFVASQFRLMLARFAYILMELTLPRFHVHQTLVLF